MPRATSAARYISLYRRVKQEGSVALQHQQHDESTAGGPPDGIPEEDEDQQVTSNDEEMNRRMDQLTKPLNSTGSNDTVRELDSKKASDNGDQEEAHEIETLPKNSFETFRNPDMESQVGEVINNLLRNRLNDNSNIHRSLYADDIKQDLRSLIPRVTIPSSTSDRNGKRSPPHTRSFSETSHVFPITDNAYNNATNKSEYNKQQDQEKKNYQPRKIPKIKKPPLPKASCQSQNRDTITPELRYSPDCNKPFNENNIHHYFQMPRNRSFSYSENFCPQYDRFASHTRRKSHNAFNVFVRPVNKVTQSKPVPYEKWMNTEDNDHFSLSDFPIPIPNKARSKQDNNSVILEKDISVERLTTTSVMHRDEINPKRHILSNVPFNYGLNNHDHKIMRNSATENSGMHSAINEIPSNNSNMLTVEKLQQLNPVFISNTDAIFDLENTFPLPEVDQEDMATSLSCRKPLQREPTWRYGQEPCPSNYEGKLMGKIDLSSKYREWKSRGQVSSLSMPGYIYDDDVLTETRC